MNAITFLRNAAGKLAGAFKRDAKAHEPVVPPPAQPEPVSASPQPMQESAVVEKPAPTPCAHDFIVVGGGGRRCVHCGDQPDLPKPVPTSFVRMGFGDDGRPTAIEIFPDGSRVQADAETHSAFLQRWARRPR